MLDGIGPNPLRGLLASIASAGGSGGFFVRALEGLTTPRLKPWVLASPGSYRVASFWWA